LFLVVYLLLNPGLFRELTGKKSLLQRLVLQLFVIGILGYFVGLLFWPYALQDVIRHPLESLRVMEHYKVSIRQIFEGEFVWSTNLPWYYLPKWFLISTPGFILLGTSLLMLYPVYSSLAVKKETAPDAFVDFILIFTLLFPAVYVVAIGSNLYSGVRQMMFILPLLAVLSVSGILRWFALTGPKPLKIGFLSLVFGLMAFPAWHQVKTFPADYIYFNALAGGNSGAWSNYEYDYYFHGLKKPSEYLSDLISNEPHVVVALNCNLTNYFDRSDNITTTYVRYLERSSEDWDYGLFGINYIHPEMLRSGAWKSGLAVKTFYHRGNPVAILLKRDDKSDYQGTQEIKIGNFEAGERLIRKALDKDPGNVWLYVQLAKMNLLKSDTAAFTANIISGKEIHPYYEPLYLLEAQRYLKEDRPEEALFVLGQLKEINPFYEPAERLMDVVRDKKE
jgi:hypothetical protein